MVIKLTTVNQTNNAN